MSLEKIEVWVHDYILTNEKIRHTLYLIYQRILYCISPKIKYEGEFLRVTPEDEYEYFFGYYDKSPWDDTGRYILALRVKNSIATADSDDKAEIVTIDLENNNELKIVAETNCWNVQQGCMLQWYDSQRILFNDFRNNNYCSVLLNLNTGKEIIFEKPIYSVSEDGTFALTLDFSRLHRLRPGYGYKNRPEFTGGEKCPEEYCIWKINLITGEITPLLKYTDFANFETRIEMEGAEHKVNHLMINPSGNRFMVLHRWIKNGQKYTRLVTCNVNGTEMYSLSDDDFVSHCNWKNDSQIIGYLNKKDEGKGYYLLNDKTKKYEKVIKDLVMDGHPSYSPNREYIITDTYPNRIRIQSLYLIKENKVQEIAKAFSPFKFKGDVRCDLHPRWSQDGKNICVDATFEGKRAVYIIPLKIKDKIN